MEMVLLLIGIGLTITGYSGEYEAQLLNELGFIFIASITESFGLFLSIIGLGIIHGKLCRLPYLKG